MMREVPVRDTDPDPYNMSHNLEEEDRSSPVAFTVDFGNSSGNMEEKSRKLERFALRSSQRKMMSPVAGQRHPESGVSRLKHHEDRSKVELAGGIDDKRSRRHVQTQMIGSGKEVIDFSDKKPLDEEDDYRNDTFESDSDDNDLGHGNVHDKNDSNPSETGTYTVDKDDDSPSSSTQEPRLESLLEETKSSYVEEWATKHAFPVTSPTSSLSPSTCTSTKSRRLLPRPPGEAGGHTSPEMNQFSPDSEQCSSLTPPQLHGSEEDDSRFMAHTQHLVDIMEERIKQKTLKKLEVKSNRSLVSRNYSTAKQELKLTSSKPGLKTMKSGSAKINIKSPEPQQEAMEAWKRRKNYDPMAAAGRKKSSDLTRKHSASSSTRSGGGLTSPPQDDTSESDSLHQRSYSRPRQSASAPGSAKSRSSESSGYLSRSADSRGGGEKVKSRPSSSTTPTSRSSTNPLRRLAHTNSSSSIKAQSQSNRSSSSLTSKEAEFQAWKRRKNYDPMKSASSRPSSSKEGRKVSNGSSKEGRKTSGGSSRSYSSSCTTETVKQSPRHKRIMDMTSREMTKSLIMEELSSEAPMQRSNSFHCNAKKNGRIQSEDESEDDYGSGYESSLADSQIRSYPHFYLDDDELILPIQPLQSSLSHLGHRSLYPRSTVQSQVSPSKSRSKLEALDTLVISTIHNVSNKLCSNSASVLRQAAAVFPDQDEEQASTLETVIYLLEDIDLPPSPAKKTSRELSGTLRNLKKIEQALEMMKKLMDSSEIVEE